MPTLARRALDHAADRAVGSPHAEDAYYDAKHDRP